MRRGDVHEYAIGSRVVRAVIVSADQYARSRLSMGRSFGLAVASSPEDPVRGSVDVGRVRPADPELVRSRVGAMTPNTMRRVSAALKEYLDLD